MVSNHINDEEYNRLVLEIFPILAEKGPSHTTMDLLARRLQMSKRTLYEIFGSKDEMIKSVMKHLQQKYSARVERIVSQSENIMEAMANILLFHQEAMSQLSADFFRDMDDRYNHLRNDYETNSRNWAQHISNGIRLGIRQGVFRTDANYDIIIPLVRVQMESLKRMEEFFPPEITLAEAYGSIALGLLRSIATPQGMRILDKLSPKFTRHTVVPTENQNL